MLWVKESYRKNGHGSELLNEVEIIAKEQGYYLVHLETMDFQAKDFYSKNGYEAIGVNISTKEIIMVKYS